MALELVQGVALLLALCFLHGVNMRLWHQRPTLGQVLSGLLFGGICAIGMLTPLHLAPGIIIDARSVVLSMAALFGGPLAALVAAAMAAATRLALGGAGLAIGLLTIVWCTGLGLAYRHARQRGWLEANPRNLLLFGLLLHLVVLGFFQGFDPEVVARINRHLALPYLLVFGPATALLGWLLRDVEQRFATDTALAENAARLQAITQSIPDVVLLLDEDGRYLEVLTPDDDRLVEPACDIVGKRMADVLPAATAERLLTQIRRSLHTGLAETLEYEIRTPTGVRQFEGRCQPLSAPVQERRAVVFIARDRTERIHAEDTLRQSELRFRTLLREIPSISVQGYLQDGTTVYWNQAAERIYGYSADEALGKNLLDLIIPPPMHDGVRAAIAQMFATRVAIPSAELRLMHKDGSAVEVFSSHAYIQTPGRPPEMFCIDIDISERKAAQEQVHYLAFYDALTGLPNRRLLLDRLQQVLASSARTGLYAAVLVLDLDQFKTLNDSRGHEVGDLLLKHASQRLTLCVRSQDTIARLGGDEFAVLLHNLSADPTEAAAQVRALGDKILDALRQPYRLDGQEHHLTASLGAAMGGGTSAAEEMLQQADLAMYRAKGSGGNTLFFFDPVMQASVNQRMVLQAEMHKALREEEFELFYQPQVNAQGHITGAEALLRWRHPEKGLVPPGVFIPLAEDTGQIIALGHWVLASALHQQARWQAHPQLAALSLSINVSARQFRQDDFVSELRDLLRQSQAHPRRIKLELTESLLLQDVDGVIAIMQELRALGLGLSLDDFGTGYSSLGYLKRLPLDQLKIDQGFVRHILQDRKDAAIAHSIIALAQKLDLDVVAEGVETEEHHQFLLDNGCRNFQGYFFGRPEPLQDFERRVLAQQSSTAAQ